MSIWAVLSHVCLYLWHHSVVLRLTGGLKKWPHANVAILKSQKVSHSSCSHYMKTQFYLERQWRWHIYEHYESQLLSGEGVPHLRAVVRAEIFAVSVFLQRRHPTTPPWFCVSLSALLVFVCPLPSHYKELWHLIENHTMVVFSSPTCRTATTTTWLSLRCLKPTNSHSLLKMPWFKAKFSFQTNEKWKLRATLEIFWILLSY